MIKINLLGDSTKIDHTNRFLVIGFVFILIIILLFCYRLYQQTSLAISQHNLKITSLQEKLVSLQKRTSVVKGLEEKKAKIKTRLLALAKLRMNRLGPVRILDDLNLSIPETVWVKSIKEANGQLEISGRSLDNQNIALLIKQLQESSYFVNVDLKESKQVYYSKKTGLFSATPDQVERGSGVGFSVRNKDLARSGMISEANVRIKEFIIFAKFNYLGSANKKANTLDLDSQVQFPELAELDKL